MRGMSSSILRCPWKRPLLSISLNAITNCIFGGLSLAACHHDDHPLRRISAFVTTSLPYLNSASARYGW